MENLPTIGNRDNNQLMICVQQPEQFLQALNPRNITDIIQSKNPSLVAISKAPNGEPIVKSLLVEIISDLISFFNIGKMMNASQVIGTAELILEAYAMYKLDDFKLCFKRAKLGYYGKVYDRIDGNVIFDWFEKYIEERNAEFEAVRAREKKIIETDTAQIITDDLPEKDKPIPMPDYIKNAIVRKIDPLPVKVLTQSDQQKQINSWMYDFDQLWEIQGSASGKRFVDLDNRKMDISEYIQFRFQNES